MVAQLDELVSGELRAQRRHAEHSNTERLVYDPREMREREMIDSGRIRREEKRRGGNSINSNMNIAISLFPFRKQAPA